MKRFILLLGFVFILFQVSLIAQEEKTLSDDFYKTERRNVIKWNLSPMIWSYSNINLSYERVLNNNNSFSVNAGYFVLPTMGVLDSLNIDRMKKKWGFSVAGDRRFYIKKRNKKTAPDGLYWGVFGAVHYYNFENDFRVIDSDIASGTLELKGNLGIYSLGVELGYQFVFKNNITVDLIFMGPSLSAYSTGLSISGDLDVDKESEYIKALYDVLVSKFPEADRLISEKSIKDNGVALNIGPGLRYMIQIGYRF